MNVMHSSNIKIGEKYIIQSVKGYFSGEIVDMDDDFITIDKARMLYDSYGFATIFDSIDENYSLDIMKSQILSITHHKDFN